MRAVEVTREMLAAKFETIFPHLDERQRRLLLGAEARALGHGGIRLVAGAAGVREARCPWAPVSWRLARSRWAGHGGPAGAASGPLTWIPGWARRCGHWSSRTSGVIRCRRCGGPPSRPARWRAS